MTQARDLADGKFDTDTLVVDAANNRVGVGTASPSSALTVDGGPSSVAAKFKYNGSNSYIVFENDTRADGYVGYDNSGNLEFWSANSERMTLLAGGGITFNGDTAAANALDDYEEGTWTPADASSDSLTLGLSGSQARYTKIGKVLLIHADITIPGTSSSEAVSINGLPFNTEQYGNGFIGWSDSNTNPNIHVAQSGGELRISFRKNDGSGDIVYGDVSGKRFMFGAIIFVA